MKKLLTLLTLAMTTGVYAQDENCPDFAAEGYSDCHESFSYLFATPGWDTYSWSPSTGLSNPNINNPTSTASATYTVTATMLIGPELVTNGDFSSGNSGFTSGHTYTTWYNPCNYYVGPGWFSATLDATKPDHTASSDNMFMSVDGCNPATVLWEQTMSITSNTDYTFSFWATRGHVVGPNFEIHFIGNSTGDVIVSTQAGQTWAGAWQWDQHVVSCWNSDDNTSVTVRVVNLETASGGNDFALDDFSFRRCCSASDVVTVPSPMGINLFTNGDFSLGNTGFTSGHNYSTVYTPGNYYVGPGWFSATLDLNYPDHTAVTNDNMFMSVDGKNAVLWEQTVSVNPNTIYNFSFWATRADAVVPKFEMHFIGDVTGDIIVNTVNGLTYAGAWQWDQYGVSCWDSDDNTTVTIRIINLEGATGGNDFALDDFAFRQCCERDYCCNPRDPDGRFAAPADKSFEVFPNPGNGSFELRLEESADNVQVEILNAVGERIDNFSFNGDVYKYSPTRALPAGVYMLRITRNGEQMSRRIVVK